MAGRVIAHVDMDAFYASIEIRDDPSLEGLPVVVGGPSEGRGVVAAASYAARRYGVHSAMPMRRAEALCPNLVRVPPHFSRYEEVSGQIMEILGRFSPLVEPLSLDEAFLDLTGTASALGPPGEVGPAIKSAVRRETRLTASVGIAPVKFVAKIASDLRKPDGLVVVADGEVEAFLHPLPIGRLWGAGPRTCEALEAMGVRTIGDLAARDPRELEARFGTHGRHLSDLACGRDEREVIPSEDARSYSHEETFARDSADVGFLEETMLSQAVRVARRLRADGVLGRVVQLKLRDGNFRTRTRRQTLAAPTCEAARIFAAARTLFRDTWEGEPVRLIGVGVSGVVQEGAETPDLFTNPEKSGRSRTLADTLDKLQDRFGERQIRPARLVRETPGRGAAAPPRGEWISRPISPLPGSFDPGSMAEGRPGLPVGFSFEGRTCRITAHLRSWKQLRPEAGGELYVRRHYALLRMEDGALWTVYCLRQASAPGKDKERWFLYKAEPGEQARS